MANNMGKCNQYKPESVSHPGKTLKAKIEEMEMSIAEFSRCANIPETSIVALINGDSPFTDGISEAIERITNIPVHFWLSRQRNHDAFQRLRQESTSPTIRIRRTTPKVARSNQIHSSPRN